MYVFVRSACALCWVYGLHGQSCIEVDWVMAAPLLSTLGILVIAVLGGWSNGNAVLYRIRSILGGSVCHLFTYCQLHGMNTECGYVQSCSND